MQHAGAVPAAGARSGRSYGLCDNPLRRLCAGFAALAWCLALFGTVAFGSAPAADRCLPSGDMPFSTPVPRVAESGAPFVIGWRDELLESDVVADCAGFARYLILAFPPEARLSGEGFLGLGPGDAAPFGIEFAQDRLRAVIPLHIPDHAEGDLRVHPFVVGDTRIDWAFANVPLTGGGHGDAVVRQGPGASIDIRPGAPQIVVQDPFDTARPMETRHSNDGAWKLEVFAGHFRVFDAESDALMLDGDGVLPGFSPTGRFLHVFHAEADSAALATEIAGLSPEEYILFSDMSVFDLVTGEAALSLRSAGWSGRGDFVTALHWSPGDSFLAVLYEAQGMIGFQPMFVDRPYFRDEFGCGACSPQTEGIVIIDAENGAATLGWAGNVRKIDLFGNVAPDLVPFYTLEGDEPPPHPPIVDDPASELARFISTWPEGMRYLEMLGRSRPSLETGYHARRKDLVVHRSILPDTAPTSGTLPPEATALRGASGLLLAAAAQINRETRLLQRLADFGVAARSAPPIAHEVIELDLADDDEGESIHDAAAASRQPYYQFDTGAAAQRARLANADEATLLTGAARGLMGAMPLCTVSPALTADVWTLRRSDGVAQLVHYTCRVGTGQEPEGVLGLIETAGGDASWQMLASAPFYPALPDGEIDWDNAADSGGPVEVAAHQALRLARLSEDLVVIAGVDGRAAVLDLRRFSVRHALGGLHAPEQIDTMALAVDGRHLVQINADGRWFLRRLADGALALSGVLVDDEVVAFDGALNFDATPEAARFVQVRFPGERRLYTLDQIGAQAQMHDLVPRAMQGAHMPAPMLRGLPPRILSVEDREGGVWLTARAEGGAEHVAVFRDGVEVAQVPIAARSDTAFVDLPALPETRWFTLQLRDAQGLISAPHSISVTPEPDTQPTGALHVIAVGTDEYDDPGISDLGFAVFDAEGFASAAGDATGRYYRDVHSEVLRNSRDLRGDLLTRLAALAERVAPEDTVFLHIAGHGFTDSTGALRLADGATRLDALDQSALAFDDVAVALSALRARVVVFVDACHSGAAAAGTNDEAVTALLASGAPVAVIAASKGRQVSFESSRLGGGAFSAALIRAFGDPRTDLNGNGVLELTELYATVKRDVVEATAGQQTPWIARSAFVGAVPLF